MLAVPCRFFKLSAATSYSIKPGSAIFLLFLLKGIPKMTQDDARLSSHLFLELALQ
jgi:hypothetical protein